MKTYLDCYPCFQRQALSAARRAQASEELQQRILLNTMQALSNLPDGATPPEMALQIHRQVREQTRIGDPYRQDKQQATQQALALYPRLKKRVESSPNPLETAVRLAIAGNIIDLGVAETYDLEANLQQVLKQTPAINDLEPLRHALAANPSILYLADNAGETVFDRVLIETLDRSITYVVKASPIINDATHEDAVTAGIDRTAEIIDNGSNAPGTLLDHCSAQFRERFDRAELIFAGAYQLLHVIGLGELQGLENQQFFAYFYYSAVVYTTLGFGDIIPPGPTKILTGFEALIGLGFITWSASFTFLEMQRYWRDDSGRGNGHQ